MEIYVISTEEVLSYNAANGTTFVACTYLSGGAEVDGVLVTDESAACPLFAGCDVVAVDESP